jgi:glutamate carboxypeptidase
MPTTTDNVMLLQFCQEHRADMLEVLKRMVEFESPSDNKEEVDHLGEYLAQQFESLGGKVTFFPQETCGAHLKIDFPGNGGKPVLLLGHFDTVWPLGTLKTMPFRVENGRAFGPGVYDMKAGITMMIFALRALRTAGRAESSISSGSSLSSGSSGSSGSSLCRPITVLLDTDEEVGSTTGRPVVEAAAKDCEAVLVLEPSQSLKGQLKTARKGVGDYTIRVRGRASHAGVDFEKGHSAVIELSRQVLEIAKFTDVARGITVNPGVIHGGTRTNVVAAEAVAEVDIRIARTADAAELERKFTSLRPVDPNCTVEISGGLNRPPMERTEGTVRLFRLAQEQAKLMGMTLDEASTGGGSDGNFTSGLGIPTLDGLGAVGEGAHASNESVILDELPRRAALLAALIRSV